MGSTSRPNAFDRDKCPVSFANVLSANSSRVDCVLNAAIALRISSGFCDSNAL